MTPKFLCWLLAGWLLASQSLADTVIDDAGQNVAIAAAAQRIITLSPHATELVYAAGAGDRIVATVDHSDYPPAAHSIPRIGNGLQVDRERLWLHAPDLVVGWLSGTPPQLHQWLHDKGMRIYMSEPRGLQGVAENIQELGQLTGTEAVANKAATELRTAYHALKQQNTRPVSVFYQTWQDPLMSIGKQHYLHQMIAECGGENIFSDQHRQSLAVDLESVLIRQPAVILTGSSQYQAAKTFWQGYAVVPAVVLEQIHALPDDLLHRPGPRLLQGMQHLCAALDASRHAHAKEAISQRKSEH